MDGHVKPPLRHTKRTDADSMSDLSVVQLDPSELLLTAVDEELDAIDIARRIRGEEQHGLGDLLGLADASGWDQLS